VDKVVVVMPAAAPAIRRGRLRIIDRVETLDVRVILVARAAHAMKILGSVMAAGVVSKTALHETTTERINQLGPAEAHRVPTDHPVHLMDLVMVPGDRRVVRAVLKGDRAVRVVAMVERREARATIRSRVLRETARSSVGSYPVADVRNSIARSQSFRSCRRRFVGGEAPVF
jgi:hypothetical protein